MPRESVYSTLILEADKAIKADALIRQALARYTELAMRQGYSLFDEDESRAGYVRERMQEIAFLSNTSWDMVFSGIFSDLFKYGNAFLSFKRTKGNSSGKSYKYFNKELVPISGVFLLSPLNMKIITNAYGKPILYQHDPSAKNTLNVFTESLNEDEIINKYNKNRKDTTTIFKPEDIIHFKYDAEHDIFGRPFFVEALEDLLMLRKTEEQIDNMFRTGMINTVIYKVGNDKFPAQKGDVEKVADTLEWDPANGISIIPGHHAVEFKEMQNIKQLIELMEYFKQRFFSGIGMSPVSMGEPGSSNRATADNNTVSMYEKVNQFQETVSSHMNKFFEHVLLDMGAKIGDVALSVPRIRFPEPNVDLKIKKENHAVFKYEHSAVTEDEMRSELGLSPVGNADGMYINKVKAKVEAMKNNSSEKEEAINDE